MGQPEDDKKQQKALARLSAQFTNADEIALNNSRNVKPEETSNPVVNQIVRTQDDLPSPKKKRNE
jgi:hypothetical protein